MPKSSRSLGLANRIGRGKAVMNMLALTAILGMLASVWSIAGHGANS
jgi:hypothetical protein